MTDLKTSVQFQVGSGNRSSVRIISTREDAEDDVPLVLTQARFTISDRFLPQGDYEKSVETIRFGAKHIRVYAPNDLSLELTSLNPLTTTEQLTTVIGPSVWSWESAYSGSQIVKLGRRSSEIVESILFDGETSKFIDHAYDSPSISILDQSSFVNETGESINAPIYDQTNGRFVTTEPVFGAFIISYFPEYTSYRIHYDIENPVVRYTAHGSDFTIKERVDPPMSIYAKLGTNIDLFSFDRESFNWRQSASINSERPPTDFTEEIREEDEETITDPVTAAELIVKKIRKVTLSDGNGGTLTLRFNNP